jgi:hypothetical protein
MTQIKCASCGHQSIELTLSNYKSVCKNCGYQLNSLGFLRSLVTDEDLSVEGGAYRFYVKRNFPNGLTHQIATLDFDDSIQCRVTEVSDLDKILPLIKELQKYYLDLSVFVVSGLSLNLKSCILCGSETFNLTEVDSVVCSGCKKLNVNLPCFVYSRVMSEFNSSHHFENGVLEIFGVTKIKKVKVLWFFPKLVTETGKIIGRFELRSLPQNEEYVLAIETPEGDSVDKVAAIATRTINCLGVLERVSVKSNIRILK